MPFETRFNEEEQVLLSTLPTLVGTVMTFAEGSGISTVKEMFASSQALLAGSKDFSANEIITGILPNMQNREEAMDKARAMRDKIQSFLKEEEVKSKDDLKHKVMDSVRKAGEVLAAKASPEEAADYKTWVLNVAENVSKAASEGGFLGFGGTRISENEKSLFRELAQAMDVNRELA